MEKFITQYQALENRIEIFLKDFIKNNGVTLENHSGKVIDINLEIFQTNLSLGAVRDYDFIDENLQLHCGNYNVIDFHQIPFEDLAYFADAVQKNWKRDELVRVYGGNIMETGEKECIYNSLESAFEEIKDGIFNDYHELRVQKWVGDDWEDIVPNKVEIFNQVENKTIYFGDSQGAVEKLKAIIIEDNEGDEYADNNILEHDDITILMHHVHQFNDNILITYYN